MFNNCYGGSTVGRGFTGGWLLALYLAVKKSLEV